METEGGPPTKPTGKVLKSVLSSITVEPVLFFTALGFGLLFSSAGNLRYYKICYDNSVGIPARELFCANNAEGGTKDLRDHIQKEASFFSEICSVANDVSGIISGAVLGAWSDRIGRKPILLIAMTGQIVYCLFYIFLSCIPEKFPAYALVAGEAIAGGSGGMSLILASSIASVLDMEKDTARLTVRNAIAEACLIIGVVVGFLAGGAMLSKTTYSNSLVAGTAVLSFAMLYDVFLVRETLPERTLAKARADKSSFLVKMKARMTELKVTLTKERPEKRRFHLFEGLLVFLLVFMTDIGQMSVMLLYLKHSPLFWSASRLTYFNAINRAVAGFGAVTITASLKMVFHARDTTVVTAAVTFGMIRCSILAGARATWMVYFSAAFQLMTGAIYPALRVLLAKFGGRSESGKIYAVIGTLETFGDLISTVVFLNIYAATEPFYAGFVFAVDAVICLIALVIVIHLRVATRNLPEDFEESSSVEEKEKPVDAEKY